VARAAAKDAASIYANASDAATGAAQAQASVSQAASNHGLGSDGLSLSLGGEWCRACTVTASVTVVIPAVDVPFAGTVGSFAWSTSSSARIDDYRSLPGEATP
jgi:hypothetical protein